MLCVVLVEIIVSERCLWLLSVKPSQTFQEACARLWAELEPAGWLAGKHDCCTHAGLVLAELNNIWLLSMSTCCAKVHAPDLLAGLRWWPGPHPTGWRTVPSPSSRAVPPHVWPWQALFWVGVCR